MFSSSASFLVLALASLAAAQNPFTFTTLTTVTAGQTFNITWAPSTGTTDTVSLVLRQGSTANLDTIATIASGIQNTGSYLWSVPSSLVAGTGYAFEIVDDGNTAIVNYSNQFDLISTNTVSSSSPSTTASTSVPSISSDTTLSTATTAKGTASSTASSSGHSSSASGTGSSSVATPASSNTAAAATPDATKSLNAAGKSGVGMGLFLGAIMAALAMGL